MEISHLSQSLEAAQKFKFGLSWRIQTILHVVGPRLFCSSQVIVLQMFQELCFIVVLVQRSQNLQYEGSSLANGLITCDVKQAHSENYTFPCG